MVTRKSKKHSGRYTPQLHQKIKFSEMFVNAEEPAEEYDDWRDFRDGLRHNPDKSHLRDTNMPHRDKEQLKKENQKITKQIFLRKIKKMSPLVRIWRTK